MEKNFYCRNSNTFCWNDSDHQDTRLFQMNFDVDTFCIHSHHQYFGSWSVTGVDVSQISWAQRSVSTRFSWSLFESSQFFQFYQCGHMTNINDATGEATALPSLPYLRGGQALTPAQHWGCIISAQCVSPNVTTRLHLSLIHISEPTRPY